MTTSNNHLSFLSFFFAIVLLGAGCGATQKQTIQEPGPQAGVIQETSVPTDLGEAEERAKEVGPPISELETPAPQTAPWDVAQEPPCPVTADIVRAQCKIAPSVSVSARGCQFDLGGAYRIFFFVRIAASEEFGRTTQGPGAPSGATVAQVVEAERLGTNIAVQIANASLPGVMHTCSRWETRSIASIGEEAVMTPVGDLGCQTDNGVARFTDTAGRSLYIRKGGKIAKVSSYQTGFNTAGCSSDELVTIAKEYVVPAM